MIKEKSNNNNRIGINYFEDLFLKRKRLYPRNYFSFPIDGRKHKIPLPKGLFRKTIKTYLNIYFGELYYHDTPKYFPLSGLIKKVKGSRFFINSIRGIIHKSRSVTWLWYLRPSISYFANVRLIKLNGSSSRVLKLDNSYKLNRDVELLPFFRSEMKEVKLFK